MARFVARCPGCHGKFPWDPTLGLPSRCPLPGCDYTSKERDETVISAPFIRSQRMKATDNSYRQLERSSEIRAQTAAELAGVPVSEMSHLKITNIRDTREGEVAAMPVRNAVTEQMDFIKRRGGNVGFGADASGFYDATQSGAVILNGQTIARGIEPSAGARMRKALHEHHERLSHGSATSDMPALETLQPGYRNRA